jgi:hypothetical protein
MHTRAYSLWHAVDADGIALTILLQERCSQWAVETFQHGEVMGQPDEP